MDFRKGLRLMNESEGIHHSLPDPVRGHRSNRQLPIDLTSQAVLLEMGEKVSVLTFCR